MQFLNQQYNSGLAHGHPAYTNIVQQQEAAKQFAYCDTLPTMKTGPRMLPALKQVQVELTQQQMLTQKRMLPTSSGKQWQQAPRQTAISSVGTLLDTPQPTKHEGPFFGRLNRAGIPSMAFKANFMQLLSDKYGEERLLDGKLLSDEMHPASADLNCEVIYDDDVVDMDSLKGERVDPHLRIYQVDKLLLGSDDLTPIQRRSLVSRRNTAKLRLRQKNEHDYRRLISVELDVIQQAVSFRPSAVRGSPSRGTRTFAKLYKF